MTVCTPLCMLSWYREITAFRRPSGTHSTPCSGASVGALVRRVPRCCVRPRLNSPAASIQHSAAKSRSDACAPGNLDCSQSSWRSLSGVSSTRNTSPSSGSARCCSARCGIASCAGSSGRCPTVGAGASSIVAHTIGSRPSAASHMPVAASASSHACSGSSGTVLGAAGCSSWFTLFHL